MPTIEVHRAVKDHRCALAGYTKGLGYGDLDSNCSGTIEKGEEYIDEVLAPWERVMADDVDDEGRSYGVRADAWYHTRWHRKCWSEYGPYAYPY